MTKSAGKQRAAATFGITETAVTCPREAALRADRFRLQAKGSRITAPGLRAVRYAAASGKRVRQRQGTQVVGILWEMFPDHPNLLASYLDGPHGMSEFVRKPLLSREGANITVHKGETETTTPGPYGEEGFVFQDLAPERSWEGMTPVIGSWYIKDMGAAGMGIREAAGVTDNLSRFVPHYFD